ncbi:MAG: murein L,D-transpeptidase [Flavisolibacter sp.]
MSAQQTDPTIRQDSYSELFFDSVSLEKRMADEGMSDSVAVRMRKFYHARGYQYAWFFQNAMAEYAKGFVDVQDDYIGYSGDSALYNSSLQQLVDSLQDMKGPFHSSDPTILKTELLLTQHFFQFASRALQGRNHLNAQELDWFIPRKKINLIALLDSLIENKGKNISLFIPLNRQYGLLKNYLLKYYAIQKNNQWQQINYSKKFKQGDSSEIVREIKNRLFALGDLPVNDSTTLFTLELKQAAKRFQSRFGLISNGIIDKIFISHLNQPVDELIRKILINMERIRWLPVQPTTDYILVNIPEFRLHVFEKGKYAWNMKIVVGSTAHNTVIFAGTLKYVVFSPYWNIPPGILKNETLPAISRNKNYLAAHNMEWHGNTVRQKPGPNNSLGLVKFLFPNDYNIYLHDTPAKTLFEENERAFSHGCIRLSEPAKLARFLLRNDPGWDSVKVVKAMNARKEKFVTVKDMVPVYIGYFTSWVDREGILNFRDDIYGHDRKLADQLFAH